MQEMGFIFYFFSDKKPLVSYKTWLVLDANCCSILVHGLKGVVVLWQAREKIISKINRTIEIYRQQGSLGVNNGVLARLLEEESLPNDAVADFIINLLFAGNETTAKTMLFAVYFLTKCPTAMKQLLVHETICLWFTQYIPWWVKEQKTMAEIIKIDMGFGKNFLLFLHWSQICLLNRKNMRI